MEHVALARRRIRIKLKGINSMNRKIKALGLALVAALALTAVMASTASAQFTSTSSHTILSGSQEGSNVFTAGEGFGSIKCTTATFSGTAETTNAADQTIFPTYAGCTDSFGRIVDTDNSSLTYTFTKTGKDASGTPLGTVNFSGSFRMTVTSSGSVVCTTHWNLPQTQPGVTWHNNAGGLSITFALVGIKTTVTGSFLNCGVSEGEHKEGTYTGTVKMTGKDTAGNPVTIAVDP